MLAMLAMLASGPLSRGAVGMSDSIQCDIQCDTTIQFWANKLQDFFCTENLSVPLSGAFFWGYFWSSFHTAIVISRISNEILTLAVPKYAIIPKINLLIYNQ
jgi:hypothetical protein